jgi:hypothetical protein
VKIIGINASPRKNANTQTLVEAVLQGAAEKGAEIRLVNLRELSINGCLGCEGCKKHPGQCIQKFYDHLDEWLNLIPLTLGAGHCEVIHQYGADIDRMAAGNDPALLAKARRTGAGLLA